MNCYYSFEDHNLARDSHKHYVKIERSAAKVDNRDVAEDRQKATPLQQLSGT